MEWCYWPTNFYSLKRSLSRQGSQSVISQSLNNSVRFQRNKTANIFLDQLRHTILISRNHQLFAPCTTSKPVVSSQSTAIICEFSQSFEHPIKLSRRQINRMFLCRREPYASQKEAKNFIRGRFWNFSPGEFNTCRA